MTAYVFPRPIACQTIPPSGCLLLALPKVSVDMGRDSRWLGVKPKS